MIHDSWQINDRVSVSPIGWSKGAANSMKGKPGTIVQIKRNQYDGRPYLVELDETPAAWHSYQLPAKQWWFSMNEIDRLI